MITDFTRVANARSISGHIADACPDAGEGRPSFEAILREKGSVPNSNAENGTANGLVLFEESLKSIDLK